MEIIFLIGFIQALFFSLLLIDKKAKRIYEKILPLWLFLIGIHLFILFLINRDLLKENYVLTMLHITFPLIHYPLFYLYVNTMVNKIEKIRILNFLHFIPFTVFLVIYVIFSNGNLLYSYNFSLSNTPPRLVHFNLIINLISGLIYLSLCLKQLSKFNKRIKDFYSNIDKINLKWLTHLIAWLCFILITGIIYIIIAKWLQVKPLNYSIDIFIYSSITVFIFFIGFYSLKKTHLFNSKRIPYNADTGIIKSIKKNEKNSKYEIYGLKKNEAAELKDKLLLYVEEKKPYLDCNLSLAQLAESLGFYKHYLTQVLNDELNQNFFDFINNYRVEEVKRLMSDINYENYTLLAIALEAGFNSKSSFNRIFKEFTRFTPSQYKKNMENAKF